MKATVPSRVVERGEIITILGSLQRKYVGFGGLWEVLEEAKVRQEYAAVIEQADRRYSVSTKNVRLSRAYRVPGVK